MDRINITTIDQETGNRTLEGWFNRDTATVWDEATRFDGNHHISLATGSQWDHERLYRTTGGRWVLHRWSQWQGSTDSWRFLADEPARDWLLINEHDAEPHFEIEPERGPGRPEVGGAAHVRLGDLLEDVDAWADEQGVTRAEAIRRMVAESLAGRMYVLTERDLSTGVRDTWSRHPNLGAAVEALRKAQERDRDNRRRGMLSARPRIEHDGRPVDVD